MSVPRSLTMSAFLGNFFEHYDTALFGFLSPFLASLIFPGHDRLTALILTYALIPLGMLARPLGSLAFGYIGDNFGRKNALVLTFSGMALVSLLIAFSPTYESVGFIAPLFFCSGRILQNFCAAGETMGGAVFLLENCEIKRQDMVSSLYNASTIGGILIASLAVSLLYYTQALDPYWRLLYVIGGLMTFLACLARGMQPREAFKAPKIVPYKMKAVLKEQKSNMFLIMVAAGFSYANYSVALVLMNGFIPLISPYTTDQMMSLNTGLLALDLAALPFFGWLSGKIGREKLMQLAAALILVLSIPLFMALAYQSSWIIILVRSLFVILGAAFAAPFHSWAQQLLPSSCRYMIISLSYALGSQLLGGPTMAFSLWIFKKTGQIYSVSLYWTILAFISFLILTFHFAGQKAKYKRAPTL